MQYRIVPNLVYDINTDNANRDDYLDLARYIYPQAVSTTNSPMTTRLVAETPCEINDNTFGAIPHIVPYSDGTYDYRQGNISSLQYTVPADYGYTNPYNYPMFNEVYPSVGKTYPTVNKSYPTVDKSFERLIPVDYEKDRQYNEIVNKISNLQAKIKEEEEDILTLDKMIYKKKDKISDYEREIVRLKSMYNK